MLEGEGRGEREGGARFVSNGQQGCAARAWCYDSMADMAMIA